MAAAVAAAAAVKKAAMAVGVDAGRALQGLTAALDRDLAHTSALVTAQMADMTVVGTSQWRSASTTRDLSGHKHRARSQ